MRWIIIALAALATVAGTGAAPDAQSAPSARVSKLFKDSRAHLADAIANDERDVTLVIAARDRNTGAIEGAIAAVGGVVQARADEIGYVRARVPVEAVEGIASQADVDAVAISITGQNFLANSEGAPAAQPQAAADLAWLIAHPYRPQRDLGIDALRAAHPTFDGRGVTIGILDGFVDPLLPAFGDALDRDGATVRKLTAQINATDPLNGDDPFWVDVSRHQGTGTATVDGAALQLPAGPWQIGWLDETRFDDHAYLRGDLNRDGNPAGSARRFALAFAPATGEVRIDLDQDGDLREERGLADYSVRGDVGTLGRDDGTTALRESVGFTLTVHPSHRFVSVNLGAASHGTEITGALVASRSPDGLMEGMAPGASVINVWQGSTTHGLIEGARAVFRDPRVDLVVVEQNVFIAMDYALDDGRSVVAVLIDRLVDVYRKPAFVPASNISGPGQMNDTGLGARAFAVGAYEHRDSWWTFAAARPAHLHNVSSTGSYGPAGSGRLKPDFVAPTRHVTPNPAFLAGGRLRDLYALEPGRGVCAGTSCATPMAAGVAAVLLSGARQQAVAVDVDRLRWALTASSLPLDLPPLSQGAGLLRADMAWECLRAAVDPLRFTIDAPVQTALAALLHTPGRGSGVVLRERVRGDDHLRVAVTRRNGPAGPVTVGLRWRTSGVFGGPASIVTTRDVPATVEFRVVAAEPGLHSAALDLVDPQSGQIWDTTMHVVAVPMRPSAAPDHRIERRVAVRNPGVGTLPIEVAPGTAALDIRVDAAVPLRLLVVPPDRKIETYFVAAQPRQRHVVPRPSPGVWLVSVWTGTDIRDRLGDRSLPADVPVSFTAAVFDVGTVAEAEGVRIVNRAAGGELRVMPSSLAARHTRRLPLSPHGQQVIPLDVPEGAEWLSARAHADRDDVDVDLHLLQCTGERCGAVRGAMSRRPGEDVFVPLPRPGRWRAVVDVFASTGPADVTLTWDVADPRLGAADAGDPRLRRATGATWTVTPRVSPRAATPADGVIVARLPVVAADLEALMWTAPAAARGMGFTQTVSWFPLAWVDAPVVHGRVP